MSKYLGPKIKIIRRLRFLPGLTQKKPKKRNKISGQHNNIKKEVLLAGLQEYNLRLLEKQKLCYNYGIRNKELYNYYKLVIKQNSLKLNNSNLLNFLESRLDSILFKSKFATTILMARQLINHGHILINKKKVTSPNYLCKINDLIEVKNNQKSKNLIKSIIKLLMIKQNLILDSLSLKKDKILYLNLNYFSNLGININDLTIKINSKILNKNILLDINLIKIMEYYSKNK